MISVLFLLSFFFGTLHHAAGHTKAETKDTRETTPPEVCEDAALIALARKAFLYGYPLVEMARLRQLKTSVLKPDNNARAPINHLIHRTKPLTHVDIQVVSPNTDTLYSTSWLDLKKGPVTLEIPPIQDRYFVFQFLSFDNDTRGMIGTSTNDQAGGRFMIVGPDWKGETPPDIKRVLRMPVNSLWMLGRTHFDFGNATDVKAAQDYQTQYKLIPSGPPDPIDTSPAPPKVSQMTALQFFVMLNKALPEIPNDAVIKEFERLGVKPGQPFQAAVPIACLEAGMAAAKADIIAGTENLGSRLPESQWTVNTKVSDFGIDYLSRAIVAWDLLGALKPEEAVYLTTKLDADKSTLSSTNKYILHFEKDQIPATHAFWSVTAYDAKSSALLDTPGARYSVNGKTLKRNEDGSLDILIQSEPPANPDMKDNWISLPASNTDFKLTTRLFLLSPADVQKLRSTPATYRLPTVRRSQKVSN